MLGWILILLASVAGFSILGRLMPRSPTDQMHFSKRKRVIEGLAAVFLIWFFVWLAWGVYLFFFNDNIPPGNAREISDMIYDTEVSDKIPNKDLSKITPRIVAPDYVEVKWQGAQHQLAYGNVSGTDYSRNTIRYTVSVSPGAPSGYCQLEFVFPNYTFKKRVRIVNLWRCW